jgi:hypothetical protein
MRKCRLKDGCHLVVRWPLGCEEKAASGGPPGTARKTKPTTYPTDRYDSFTQHYQFIHRSFIHQTFNIHYQLSKIPISIYLPDTTEIEKNEQRNKNNRLGKVFLQGGGMIHAIPVIDFVGVIQAKSLEIGIIEMNGQPIPAVRFLLVQNQPYPILAFGTQAGEVFAYCASALENGMENIDVKITCNLITDVIGSLHVTTSSIAWYTSREVRDNVAVRILNISEKGANGEFKTRATPFIVVKPAK